MSLSWDVTSETVDFIQKSLQLVLLLKDSPIQFYSYVDHKDIKQENEKKIGFIGTSTNLNSIRKVENKYEMECYTGVYTPNDPRRVQQHNEILLRLLPKIKNIGFDVEIKGHFTKFGDYKTYGILLKC